MTMMQTVIQREENKNKVKEILARMKTQANITSCLPTPICHAPKSFTKSDKLAAKSVLERLLADSPRAELASIATIIEDINE